MPGTAGENCVGNTPVQTVFSDTAFGKVPFLGGFLDGNISHNTIILSVSAKNKWSFQEVGMDFADCFRFRLWSNLGVSNLQIFTEVIAGFLKKVARLCLARKGFCAL